MNGIHSVQFSMGNSQLAGQQMSTFNAGQSQLRAAPRVMADTTLSGAHFYANPSASSASPLDAPSYQSERARTRSILDRYTKEWKSRVLDKSTEVSANSLTTTLRSVMGALMELGPGAIDLTGLPQSRVNGHHLAIVLRATLRRQETTPGWSHALEVARFALSYDGFDETTVLSGLMGR